MTTPADEEAPIYGDVLNSILTHVPLIHLLPASQVSRSWNGAVSTSLRRFNKPKPWLILHAQNTRSPYPTTAAAFDPRSRVWVEIHKPVINYVSALRSAHSSLLYMLSPAKFSFSFDSLNREWDHVDAPIMWRTDPIVGKVGKWVVIAGGTCDFEDDPLAVEMYDVEARAWRTCESMPAIFKDSAASTWLTIAVGEDVMYVAERSTGVGYGFRPETAVWSGPYDVRPRGGGVCASALGMAGGRLILAGVTGDGGNQKVKGMKLWELDGETMECGGEIGEIPAEYLKLIEPEFVSLSSVNVNFRGDFVFVTNNSAPEWVIVGEFEDGGRRIRWSCVRNAVVDDAVRVSSTVVYTVADVDLGDLHRAAVSADWRLSLKDGA
ncbi:F-box/kelch-repeat protein At1g23390 [Linum perenne]